MSDLWLQDMVAPSTRHALQEIRFAPSEGALETSAGLSELSPWLQTLPQVEEQMGEMVAITDCQRRKSWSNNAYQSIAGGSQKELIGQRACEPMYSPHINYRSTAKIESDLSVALSVSGVELINYTRDGHPNTVLLKVEPIRDLQGGTLVNFSLQADISERRSLARDKAQLQHKLRVTQKLGQIGRIEYDHQRGRSRWSSELFHMLQQPVSDEARDFEALVALCAPATQASVKQKLELALQTGETFDEEFPLELPGGLQRWVRCHGVSDFSGQGGLVPDTWFVQDVSVYHDLVEERRRTNEMLSRMVEDRTQQLVDANRALTEFSHALSHDLKKPIRHMVSYAELLQLHLDEGDLDRARDYGMQVRAAGARLHHLVEAMLKFTRLGRRALQTSAVPMAELLAGIVEDAQRSWPGRSIEIRGIDDLPTVHADPVLIREVWTNLVDNAIKYSAHQVLVEISFGHTSEEAGTTVWIRDQGCGFDATQHDHILQMFGRACDDAAIPGDGIGLALAKQIVDSHVGGRLWGESKPGQGATFHVHLPTLKHSV